MYTSYGDSKEDDLVFFLKKLVFTIFFYISEIREDYLSKQDILIMERIVRWRELAFGSEKHVIRKHM